MRLWAADLLGLAIGFALGGSALAWFAPQLVALREPSPAAVAPSPALSAAPSPATPLHRTLASTRPAPAPMPEIRYPAAEPTDETRAPALLPAIVEPAPAQGAGVSGHGVAGTGFFIADDGSVLTAAHVVRGCARTQIVSRLLPLTDARLLAADRAADVALLRAPAIRPPAVLPLALPTSRRLFILGFPAATGLKVPAETWGTLENGPLPGQDGPVTDPRDTVWLRASAVAHGYSGGPILDPRSGAVVGIVQGSVAPRAARMVRAMSDQGLTTGPGAGRLLAFLRRVAPMLDVSSATRIDDDTEENARRATVHVLCWH